MKTEKQVSSTNSVFKHLTVIVIEETMRFSPSISQLTSADHFFNDKHNDVCTHEFLVPILGPF